MNFKEGIEKIKVLMASIVAPTEATPAPEPPAPAQKFEEVKTADGKVLTIDKLEVGGNVLIDGVAAPDGEYKLENGNSLQVVGGLIAELSSPLEDTVPEEPLPAAMTIEQLAAEVAQLKKQLCAKDTQMAAQSAAFAKQAEATNQMVELLEQFSNQSIQKPTAPTKSWDDMTPLERFKFRKQLEEQKQN